jgi:nucleoside phosphorylase
VVTEISAPEVLLYIALGEEFEAIRPVLGPSFVSRELPGITLMGFFGEIHSPVLGRNVRIVVIPAGKMGNTRAATVISTAIDTFKPANVVVLGIAGSLTSDMEPGDVFIPASVKEYLANAAAVSKGKRWRFQTSGNELQTSPRLLNRFQFFAQSQPDYYAKWRTDVAAHRAALLDKKTLRRLAAEGLKLREDCKVHAGDDQKLASGPAVGKGKAFLDWLKEVDRKIVAIEMESAGAYDAAAIRDPCPRVIALRGISDFADARKKKIERAAKNRLREQAARNALSFLMRAIEAGLLVDPNPVASEDQPSVDISSGRATIPQLRLKSAFIIGGVTEETNHPKAELPRLNHACLKLGGLFASAGAQIHICSPFPDSADYYVAMGYADAKSEGRVIHLHSPTHPTVAEETKRFMEFLRRDGLTIQPWHYPGPDDEASWQQAWLLPQLQALERVDLVVALGGKVSKSASTLLHLAEARNIPIVPFPFLGGAAKRVYARKDWKHLVPDLDATIMERDTGIDQTIDIANCLMRERIGRSYKSNTRPQTLFISASKKDGAQRDLVIDILRAQGLEALTGENQIRNDQMVPASIQQALLRSDVCVVLWSQNYALSPWCYDELSIAVRRQSLGSMNVWLLNLDSSSVVPTEARKLPFIPAGDPAQISEALRTLLSMSGEPRDRSG